MGFFFYVIPPKIIVNANVKELFLFSSERFRGASLRFKSLAHFKLIYVSGVRKGLNFIILHVNIQFSQISYWKSFIFPSNPGSPVRYYLNPPGGIYFGALVYLVHLKEWTPLLVFTLISAGNDNLLSVPWVNPIISGIRVKLDQKMWKGCRWVCSGVCSWWACYKGLRSHLVTRWMGLPPLPCSVGWHWGFQGPQTVGRLLDVKTVWLLPGPWPRHWMGNNGPGSQSRIGTVSQGCFSFQGRVWGLQTWLLRHRWVCLLLDPWESWIVPWPRHGGASGK